MRNLTNSQRNQIAGVARTLSSASRLAFLADVQCAIEARCGSHIVISNGDVQRAIEEVLDAAPWPRSKSVFMCDSKQEATVVRQHDEDEDDAVLAAGESLVVPMYAMDAQQKAVREHFGPLGFRDVQGKTPMLDAARAATHRPGFRYAADPYARDEALIALADYDRELQDAYKAPLPYQTEVTGVGAASAPRGAKKGDSCLIGGMEGHLVEIDGELTCIPDSVDDAASLSDREIAHLKYLDHVSNAWRTPGGDVVSDHRPAQRADVAPTRDAVEAAYAAYDAEIQERWRNPT